MDKIILFDGDCHFCDASVQFIIKRDPKGHFKFASLQSESGIKLLKQHQIPTHMDSFLYIDGDKWYSKSTAALKVAKRLRGCVKLSYPLIIVPRLIRDFFYNIISKNRYKWFGKKRSEEHTSELQSRFDLVCRLLLEKKKTKNNDESLRTTDPQRRRLLAVLAPIKHTITRS